MHPNHDTVWIDGAPGSGKTTLIERLLESDRTRSIGVGRVVARSQRPRGSGTLRRDDAVDRYKKAGACATDVVEGKDDDLWDEGQEARRRFLGKHGADAVLLEGAPGTDPGRYMGSSQVGVFVLPPLPVDEPLVRKATKELTRIPWSSYLTLASGGKIQPAEDPEPHPVCEDDDEGEIIAEIPDEVGEKILEYVDKGVPVMGSGWETSPGCEGVVHATIYVVNIRDESDRAAAERTAGLIRQLRGNGPVLRTFHGAAWESRRISVFIANLNDPRDPELKKAIARIKRGLARGVDFDANW